MNLGELKEIARVYLPGAKGRVVSDTSLTLILNAGKVDVASYTKCLEKDKSFDISANKSTYSITSDIGATDFLSIQDIGVKLYNGTDWKEIDPKTKKYIENYDPNWLNAGTSFPIYYWQDNDEIGFYKTPGTDRTAGGRLYYYSKGEKMVSDDDYPFHVDGDKTTEMASLEILSDSVLDYFKWKAQGVLSKSKTDQIAARDEYYANMEERMRRIDKRENINKHKDSRRRQRRGIWH